MTGVAGRVAVVTGGASGIGRGIAEALRDAGAAVVIADIDGSRAEAVAAELGASGLQCDVSDARSVEALRDRVVAQHGEVGILVNNAGVGSFGRLSEMTADDWEWMLGVNLYGVIHGVQSFLPVLERASGGAHIVNTASMAAFSPSAGMGAYAVAKTGVLAFSEVLALELEQAGSAVRVGVITPGPVHTAIGSSQRTRPSVDATGLHDGSLDPAAMPWLKFREPREIGDLVVRSIEEDRFLIVTHPEQAFRVAERSDRILGAFAAAEAELT